MVCPKCQSESVSQIPAEIRLYRDRSHTLNHPPLTPSPEVLVCGECGWAEFLISQSWLSGGWLRQKSEPVSHVQRENPVREAPVLVPPRLAVVM
jgi:hypothetical protein